MSTRKRLPVGSSIQNSSPVFDGAGSGNVPRASERVTWQAGRARDDDSPCLTCTDGCRPTDWSRASGRYRFALADPRKEFVYPGRESVHDDRAEDLLADVVADDREDGLL